MIKERDEEIERLKALLGESGNSDLKEQIERL